MNSRICCLNKAAPATVWTLILSLLVGIAQSQEASFGESCLDTCGDAWRVRADYLFWWTKGNRVPALVTTSPDGTPRDMAGVVDTPGFETLFGGQKIDDSVRPGGRLTLSRWLDDTSQTAVEGVFLYLGDAGKSGDFSATSFGSPILARPLFNVIDAKEDSQLVAFPEILDGRVDVYTSSEIYSAELLGRWNSRSGPRGNIDLLAGYRYFHFGEKLGIREQLTSVELGGVVPLDTQFDLYDRFATQNDFHGAQVGVAAEFWHSLLSLELSAKVALGNIRRQWQTSGETTTRIPGQAATSAPGGLLSLPTNMGTHADNHFAVLPEFGINGTVLVTRRLSFVCGYSLLMLNHVARTGDQIDRSVNPSQLDGGDLAGPPRPAAKTQGADFWVQGLNLGLDYRW